MRILSWVQSKIQEKKEKRVAASKNFRSPEIDHTEPEEEWPHCLLSIGTLGNHEQKRHSKNYQNALSIGPLQSIPEFTEEEIERENGEAKQKAITESQKKAKPQKPISFLLKKMFVCSGGFASAPSMGDTILESQTEKLLRMLVSRKVYPQSSPQATMKFLGKRVNPSSKVGEKMIENEKDSSDGELHESCRWVNTDSEFIVLEI